MTKAETIAYLKELNNALKKEYQLWEEKTKASKLYNKVKNSSVKTEEEINACTKKHKLPFYAGGSYILIGIFFGGVLSIAVSFVITIILSLFDIFPDYSTQFRAEIIMAATIWLISISIGIRYYCREQRKGMEDCLKIKSEYIKENENLKNLKCKSQQIYDKLNRVNLDYENQEAYVEKLKSKNILHESYCEVICIDHLISFLEQGRADNLKEAINLYHNANDAFDREREEGAYRKQKLQLSQKLLQETQRAADAQQRLADAEEYNGRVLSDINRRESWKEFEEDIGLRRKK